MASASTAPRSMLAALVEAEAVPLEAVPLEAVPLEAVPLEAVPLEAVLLEAVPLEAAGLEVELPGTRSQSTSPAWPARGSSSPTTERTRCP